MDQQKTHIPLMRVSVILPFLAGLTEQEESRVLDRLGTTREDVTADKQFLAAETVYSVVEWCAEITGNQRFGISTGLALDISSWPPFREAKTATRLVEFLSRFAVNATQHATSTRYILELGAKQSTFRQIRTFRPSMLPAQADAFNLGLMINLLTASVGVRWDPSQISLQVCAPAAMVAPEVTASKILIGDRTGVACRFPSEWLWEECNFRERNQVTSPKASDELPLDVEDIISQLLSSGLPISEINTPRLASMLGIKPRMLRARLGAKGTSLSKVLDSVKRKQAINFLGSQGMTVAQAAETMGYTDAANFTRAFRRLTGTTPKAFQKSRGID